MPVKSWTIEETAPHVVDLQHSEWSGSARIDVDGETIFERSRKLLDTGFEHRFKVDGIPAILRCISRGLHFDYELYLDGKLQ